MQKIKLVEADATVSLRALYPHSFYLMPGGDCLQYHLLGRNRIGVVSVFDHRPEVIRAYVAAKNEALEKRMKPEAILPYAVNAAMASVTTAYAVVMQKLLTPDVDPVERVQEEVYINLFPCHAQAPVALLHAFAVGRLSHSEARFAQEFNGCVVTITDESQKAVAFRQIKDGYEVFKLGGKVEKSTQTERPRTPSDLEVVQFCPCGHVSEMTLKEVRKLGGGKQMSEIDAGRKLDAPILSSQNCPECREWTERQDQLTAYLTSDWPDPVEVLGRRQS